MQRGKPKVGEDLRSILEKGDRRWDECVGVIVCASLDAPGLTR
jgi:hypothetical protein